MGGLDRHGKVIRVQVYGLGVVSAVVVGREGRRTCCTQAWSCKGEATALFVSVFSLLLPVDS